MNWDKFGDLSVLIIDDDHFTRELITVMLQQVPNITIYQANNGKEALAKMVDLNLDMIFLDLYMPKLDGQEFIETIRKNNQFQDTPIVLITTDRLNRVTLSKIGADYYLTKPFDFQNFLAIVYSFFEQETLANET